MVAHLGAFSESAARDGLDYLIPCLPAALEPIATYNGDNMRLSRPTNLLGAVCISEAEANVVDWRIKRATDPNWLHFNHAIKCDDGDLEPDVVAHIGAMQYPLAVNDNLICQVDNGNNAQLETVICYFGQPGDISLVPLPFNKVIEGTATGTLVVDTFTDCGEITWSEEFDAAKVYKIVGMSGYSATGHAFRLNLTANGILNKPGTIAGTTVLAGQHLIWGNLGAFAGTTPPSLEFLANTADTAEVITLYCQV